MKESGFTALDDQELQVGLHQLLHESYLPLNFLGSTVLSMKDCEGVLRAEWCSYGKRVRHVSTRLEGLEVIHLVLQRLDSGDKGTGLGWILTCPSHQSVPYYFLLCLLNVFEPACHCPTFGQW